MGKRVFDVEFPVCARISIDDEVLPQGESLVMRTNEIVRERCGGSAGRIEHFYTSHVRAEQRDHGIKDLIEPFLHGLSARALIGEQS